MRVYFCRKNKRLAAKFISKRKVNLFSAKLGREVIIDFIFPIQWRTAKEKRVLIFNDGQDSEAIQLSNALEKLYLQYQDKPLLVIAVYASNDRLQEYGTSGKPDYLQRGSAAHLYEWFIINELIPFAEKEFSFTMEKELTAFAGFSLGGLSALNIVWNNEDVFSKVGVFSGSLWWRSKPLGKGYKDTDRIMHSIIKKSKRLKKLKFWFQTGSDDEINDRNTNGIIDSIDDTLDLIEELTEKGFSRKTDIDYVEVKDGKHHPYTWAQVLPQFLNWVVK